MSNFFENDYAEYRLLEGIVHVTYKKGVSINLEAAVEIVNDRLRFQEGESYPVLCNICHVREVNKSARDYLANEGSLWISALAFIIEPPVSEALSRFYLKTNYSPIQTESFERITEALEYLKRFLLLLFFINYFVI
ncbi:hypothetical protein K8352_17575 [Flavobacteriaceae bacterium F89]|uniref:DUF7793 domain-containing protein n=1 Tax=Cerina litoralis TaxID=2874477 RepID=A0AAE3EZN7_9FLAO|nr:hypothetical protein [Cerina litoralis]MCG2462576.1 hypothetical protein [Cerina litoralis]